MTSCPPARYLQGLLSSNYVQYLKDYPPTSYCTVSLGTSVHQQGIFRVSCPPARNIQDLLSSNMYLQGLLSFSYVLYLHRLVIQPGIYRASSQPDMYFPSFLSSCQVYTGPPFLQPVICRTVCPPARVSCLPDIYI
jgi:hypothetical protein